MRLALVLALLAAAALSDSAAGRSMMPAGKKLPKAGKKAPATGAGTKGADSDDAKAAPDAGAGAPGGASGLTSEKDEMVEEAAALVEAGQFEEAESLLLDVGRLTKKSKSRALFESLKGQVALGYEPEGKSRRDEALAAFRKAVKLGPKDPVHKMRLARLLLADVHGCTSGCPSGSDKFAEEAGELIGKVLRSGVSGREKLEARLIQVRVLRADAGRTEGTAKQAEETLTELIQSTGLNKENLDVAGPEDVDLYCRMMLESGHLYLQHSMFNNAVQMYQQAHDAAPANSRIKAEGQQGGANCMAKNAKCDKGAKAADCGKALNLFKEVPNQFVTGDAWWMRGQIHKNVYDDIQPAMEAMVAACARVDYNAAWWDKLARWSQMLHHRLPSGGFDNHAIKQGRDAMQRNHELNPYSAPQWEEKVPTILEEQAASGTAPGDFQCKNPIPQKGEGFLEEDSLEQSAFTLYNHDPDYTCESITVEEALQNFDKLVDRHRPVIIKDATASWPFPPSGWTEEEISRRAGHEVVDVAFTEEDGHLNRFEPMEKWTHVFKDAHWQINDVVLARPKYEHLYFKEFLALLHRGGAAKERNSYLHQTEMNMFFPDLLNMTQAPPWMPDNVWLKEINLWMSSGGTVTSLHMDTSENVMHMIAGSKEFLLFRPNQIKHLHYESVPEIRYDDSSQGPGARINDIHGLVDPVSPNLVRFPDYKKAHGMRCHVQKGDALYVPSFWHHAVYSTPGEQADGCRNIGINYWYIAQKTREQAMEQLHDMGGKDEL